MKLLKIDYIKSQQFLCIIGLLFLLIVSNDTVAQEKFKVVLDAGHGGKDPGKNNGKFNEKDIALNISLLVGKKLENTSDIQVVYTRKTDVFVDLKERGQIANQADANLFVSIHCNAHNTQAFGTETYVLGLHANERNFEVAKQENSVIFLEDNYQEKYQGFDPNSPEAVIGLTLMQEEYLDQSLLLASNIQKNFTVNLQRNDRGVKQAGFVVLHQTYMPSVLIETGFITNTSEGEFLNSKSGQEKVSEAIFNAIISYKKHLDENVAVEDKSIQNPNPVSPNQRIYEGIDFKVQIASGAKKLELKSYNFKGLKDVELMKIGSLYKYYFGRTSDYNEILKLRDQARLKGYDQAFVVAFNNGKSVSVSEILKSP